MIEPPSKPRRARILEIDDRILVTIESTLFEWLGSFVRHSRIEKLSFRIDSLAVETRKNCGRGGPVKTLIVETNANFQFFLLPPLETDTCKGKSIKMDVRPADVKQETCGRGS